MKYKIIETKHILSKYELWISQDGETWRHIYQDLRLESVREFLEEVKSGKRNYKGEIEIEAGEI